MKILILGHNGLLGNMVYKYFKDKYETIITNLKWETDEFKDFIIKSDADYIINCIGKIPQKKPIESDYNKVNFELPKWLDNLGIKIIHPDTDENGNDPYSISKIKFREYNRINTKVIRTSIIGPELKGNYSFMNWFLNSENEVNGYINQYWNGNTTLEWSKWAEKIILDWDNFKDFITISNTDCLSKYEILKIIKKVFNKDIKINSHISDVTKNNCLEPDFYTKKLENQLIDLKNFIK
jgi:dTDP-4-dehydrorhamnose reductase